MASDTEKGCDTEKGFLGCTNYSALPITVLRPDARKLLAEKLDPTNDDCFTAQGILQDYRGLGEILEFSQDEITPIDDVNEKTFYLLDLWSKEEPEKATIGGLWEALRQLEREDISQNISIKNAITEDADYHLRMEAKLRQNAEKSSFIDVYEEKEMAADEFKEMVIGEVGTGGKHAYFDAFISFSDKNIKFVKEMIRVLEGLYGLKLCVPQRDFVIGSAKLTITAKLIAERCKKVIVVLSPDFLKESECDFQVKFAHVMSEGHLVKRMVPILFESCEIPQILQNLTMAYWQVDSVREHFWTNVRKSIQDAGCDDIQRDLQSMNSSDVDELSSLEYNFSHKTTNFDSDSDETSSGEEQVKEQVKETPKPSEKRVESSQSGGIFSAFFKRFKSVDNTQSENKVASPPGKCNTKDKTPSGANSSSATPRTTPSRVQDVPVKSSSTDNRRERPCTAASKPASVHGTTPVEEFISNTEGNIDFNYVRAKIASAIQQPDTSKKNAILTDLLDNYLSGENAGNY